MLCKRCDKPIAGPYVAYVEVPGYGATYWHSSCFIESHLEPGQLSDVGSATWGGQKAPAREGEVSDLGMAGKRAILIEDFDSKRWE